MVLCHAAIADRFGPLCLFTYVAGHQSLISKCTADDIDPVVFNAYCVSCARCACSFAVVIAPVV